MSWEEAQYIIDKVKTIADNAASQGGSGSQSSGGSQSQVSLPITIPSGSNTSIALKANITEDLGDIEVINQTARQEGSVFTPLPFPFLDGCVVIHKNQIHILGGNGQGSGSDPSYLKHYKWNGSSWVFVSTLPYNFYGGSAVSYAGEIHIFGSDYSNAYNKHYKWDGSSWVSASSIPYNFTHGKAIVWNGSIHLLGSLNSSGYRKHYKWDRTSWTEVSTLPIDFYYGSAVAYGNGLHILGGSGSNNKHYKWDGSSWTEVSTLPYNYAFADTAVTFDNKIHISGGSNYSTFRRHYEWDGSSWVQATDLPFELYKGNAITYKNKIYIFGGANNRQGVCLFDGTSWSFADVKYEVLSEFHHEYAAAVVFDGCIYDMGGNGGIYRTVKWDGHSWIEMGDIPYGFAQGNAVVYNGTQLRILGADYAGDRLKVLIFNGTSWNDSPAGTLPRLLNRPSAVTVGNEIHIMGGYGDNGEHYKSTNAGVDWTLVSTLPYKFCRGAAVVLNGEIHILGGYYNPNAFRYHYKWNGTSWVSVSTLPYDFYEAGCVVINNEIHILGSNSSTYSKKHYKWDGTSWIELPDLPVSLRNSNSAVVFNDEIHILTDKISEMNNKPKHYRIAAGITELIEDKEYEGVAIVTGQSS